MCSMPPRARSVRGTRLRAVLVALTALLAGACSKDGPLTSPLTDTPKDITTASTPGAPEAARAELKKATEYWGGVYAKDPSDGQAAYNYARNLKAMGQKQQALAVLQSAAPMNPMHRGILGEYGRLALEFDQVTLAEQLLEKADDPANPDWRVISARGTAKAKQGLYGEAIPFYERAMQAAPDQASILSNLGLAYTMDGHPEKGEPLLKRAAALRNADQRVNQNLSLVLGVQGKYEEAKLLAQNGASPEKGTDNVDYLRKMVKAPAKPLAKLEKGKPEKKETATKSPEWSTKVVAAN